MKKLLLILTIVGWCNQLVAQSTGELPVINTNEVNLLISEAGIISEALEFSNGRLKCLPNSCQSALPVKMLLFEGHRVTESLVKLKWQTTNEINNAGFEVERSLGNTNQFEKVGFVAAKASSSAVPNYNFDDANNFSGVSYYRLKQLDVDGRYQYSAIVAVRGYSGNANLVVYPNPVLTVLNIAIESTAAASGTVSVYDLSGKLVLQQTTAFKKGNNLRQIAVDKLIPGMYMLKLDIKDQVVKTERFVKQ